RSPCARCGGGLRFQDPAAFCAGLSYDQRNQSHGISTRIIAVGTSADRQAVDYSATVSGNVQGVHPALMHFVAIRPPRSSPLWPNDLPSSRLQPLPRESNNSVASGPSAYI